MLIFRLKSNRHTVQRPRPEDYHLVKCCAKFSWPGIQRYYLIKGWVCSVARKMLLCLTLPSHTRKDGGQLNRHIFCQPFRKSVSNSRSITGEIRSRENQCSSTHELYVRGGVLRMVIHTSQSPFNEVSTTSGIRN